MDGLKMNEDLKDEKFLVNLESLDNINSSPVTIKDFYELLLPIIKFWSDFDDIQQKIVAIWIIGTYAHDKFNSYPYLFLNAMKQSGKSRLLRLLSVICKRGKLISNITEAGLFRMPVINKGTTLCIDEVEDLSSPEKAIIRGLLNTGYKKGVYIPRVKRLLNGEFTIEELSVYTPIALANITGINDVLEDRCITILLERSVDLNIVMKMEYFEYDYKIRYFLSNIITLIKILETISNEYFYNELNNIISDIVNDIKNTDNIGVDTLDTLIGEKEVYPPQYTTSEYSNVSSVSTVSNTSNVSSVSTVSNTNNIIINKEDLKRIIKRGIFGRNLELWLPIFILAKTIDEELLNNIIEYAGETVLEKADIDLSENRDTIFLDFLYQNDQFHFNFFFIKDIVEKYKENSIDLWFNNNWVARALRRHKLILERRRTGNKKYIRIDVNKLNKLAKNLNLKKAEKEIAPTTDKSDKDNLEDFV